MFFICWGSLPRWTVLCIFVESSIVWGGLPQGLPSLCPANLWPSHPCVNFLSRSLCLSFPLFFFHLSLCCRMAAPGVAVVPWKLTSKWKNRLRFQRHLKRQRDIQNRRWNWVLTSHLGFFWRGLCSLCVTGHLGFSNLFVRERAASSSSSPLHMFDSCAMGVWLQVRQAGALLSPSIISPAKVHHVPLRRRKSKEKENVTSKSLQQKAGWVLLLRFARVDSQMH